MIPMGHALVSAGRVVRVRTARHRDRLGATFEVPHKGHLRHGAIEHSRAKVVAPELLVPLHALPFEAP
jgi:hypothetical protein